MARYTYPDGRTGEFDDSNTALADYYRGEGADVEVASIKQAAQFPVVHQPDGTVVSGNGEQVEQLPDGEYAEGTGEFVDHPGTGEPMQGVEAPADGTPVEISNDDRPHPGPGVTDPAA